MPSISRKGSPSISMRSAKVPLSPSSALQTMYFWSAATPATVRHLIPVGKARAAAPAQARGDDLLDRRARAQRDRAVEPREAAVPAIIVERQRIDDAAARENQPLLVLEIGDLVDQAERFGVRAAARGTRRRTARARRRGQPARRRSGPRRVSTSTIGSSQKRPREPVRTSATSSPRARASSAMARAAASAPTERAAESPGTKTRALMARPPRAVRATISSIASRSSRPIGSPSSSAAGESAQLPRQ